MVIPNVFDVGLHNNPNFSHYRIEKYYDQRGFIYNLLRAILTDIEIKPILITKNNVSVNKSNGITTIKLDNLCFTLSRIFLEVKSGVICVSILWYFTIIYVFKYIGYDSIIFIKILFQVIWNIIIKALIIWYRPNNPQSGGGVELNG